MFDNALLWKENIYGKNCFYKIPYFFITILTLSLTGTHAVADSTSPENRILPLKRVHNELITYIAQHISKFTAPTDTIQWKQKAEKIRKYLLEEAVFRGVPKSWLIEPTEVVWGETIDADDYTIRKMRYKVVPGLWVGGLLYEPKNLTSPVPAILNVHGHVGKPGMCIDYKQAMCINLAKRGMLVLSPEWIGTGQLNKPGFNHNNSAYLDICGVPGISIFYLSLKRGLDILCSHKYTDPERVAVTGLSGGGWQTLIISSLDLRVKLAVPNAGFMGIERRLGFRGDVGDLEQHASDFFRTIDYAHLTAMLVPRPALLIFNAEDDCCFQAWNSVPSVYVPVVPVYKLFGVPEKLALHVNYDPGTHNYLQDNREAFYRFLNHYFLPENKWIDKELPVESEILSQEELAISYPPDNADFYTLADELMRSLPRNKLPNGSRVEIDKWRNETRDLLKKVVRPEPEYAGGIYPVGVHTFSDTLNGIPGHAFRIRLFDSWTLPVIEYTPQGKNSDMITLIIADNGLPEARPIAHEVLTKNGHAIITNCLLTGEIKCDLPQGEWENWFYTEMISGVGKRTLGIQVSQIDRIIQYIHELYPENSLRVITKGRVAGLAALVYSALEGQTIIENLELREMISSLKNPLIERTRYEEFPSLFCFGLLELVDVPN